MEPKLQLTVVTAYNLAKISENLGVFIEYPSILIISSTGRRLNWAKIERSVQFIQKNLRNFHLLHRSLYFFRAFLKVSRRFGSKKTRQFVSETNRILCVSFIISDIYIFWKNHTSLAQFRPAQSRRLHCTS